MRSVNRIKMEVVISAVCIFTALLTMCCSMAFLVYMTTALYADRLVCYSLIIIAFILGILAIITMIKKDLKEVQRYYKV